MSAEQKQPPVDEQVPSAILRNRSALTWLWRIVFASACYFLLLALIAVGLLLFNESAPRWLWQQAQSSMLELDIDGLSGSLVTGLHIETLRWRNEANSLQIDQLAVSLSYTTLLSGRLTLDHVQAQKVSVHALKASESEVFVPPTIRLPMRWGLADVSIQQLQWTAFGGDPLIIDKLALSAHGQGSNLSIDALSVVYADW
ncbi:MAG: hypothetical protein ABIR53_02285, partial [Paraperlucidibaca sp.]